MLVKETALEPEGLGSKALPLSRCPPGTVCSALTVCYIQKWGGDDRLACWDIVRKTDVLSSSRHLPSPLSLAGFVAALIAGLPAASASQHIHIHVLSSISGVANVNVPK